MSREFDIETELKKLPKTSGVYPMHDADGVLVDTERSMHTRIESEKEYLDSMRYIQEFY